MSKLPFNPEVFGHAVIGFLVKAGEDASDLTLEINDREGVMYVQTQPLPEVGSSPLGLDLSTLPPEKIERLRKGQEEQLAAARVKYRGIAKVFRTWLDDYEIVFSETEVRFGQHERHGRNEGEYLKVRVAYPVEEKPDVPFRGRMPPRT